MIDSLLQGVESFVGAYLHDLVIHMQQHLAGASWPH